MGAILRPAFTYYSATSHPSHSSHSSRARQPIEIYRAAPTVHPHCERASDPSTRSSIGEVADTPSRIVCFIFFFFPPIYFCCCCCFHGYVGDTRSVGIFTGSAESVSTLRRAIVGRFIGSKFATVNSIVPSRFVAECYELFLSRIFVDEVRSEDTRDRETVLARE